MKVKKGDKVTISLSDPNKMAYGSVIEDSNDTIIHITDEKGRKKSGRWLQDGKHPFLNSQNSNTDYTKALSIMSISELKRELKRANDSARPLVEKEIQSRQSGKVVNSWHLSSEEDVRKCAKELEAPIPTGAKMKEIMAAIKKGAADNTLIPMITGRGFYHNSFQNGVQRAQTEIQNKMDGRFVNVYPGGVDASGGFNRGWMAAKEGKPNTPPSNESNPIKWKEGWIGYGQAKKAGITNKSNWFSTLNEALASENLMEAWDAATFGGIGYGQTKTWTWQDGSKYGRYISIFRDNNGMYERPVHYKR